MSDPATPKFSPFPWHLVPVIGAADAAFGSALARWLGGRAHAGGAALAAVLGAPVAIRGDGVLPVEAALAGAVDPRGATQPAVARADADAAWAEVRIADACVWVSGDGLAVRAIAQRVLGGPAELAAPRPLVASEHAVFALVLATACEDLGAPTDVAIAARLGAPTVEALASTRVVQARLVIARGDADPRPWLELPIRAYVPRALALRPPPARAWPAWSAHVALALPAVIARAAIPRTALAGLAPGDIVTVDGRRDRVELELGGGGAIGLAVAPGAVEARVATGYGVRDMALPDDAHAELAVTIGTVQLPLRRLAELAVGEVVTLGRPLGGPFELRVGGAAIGTGELVDVDGELGVRVLTIAR